MRSKIMRAVAVALLCSVAFASTPVLAAPPSSKGAPVGYESKWREVIAAEKAEEYERAIALLDEIPQQKLTIHARLKKADLLVRLGRFVQAEEILAVLLKDPAADAVREMVQADLDDLHKRMPKLTVRIADGSPKELWVTVDGEHVGPPVTIPINPGTHVVAASRDGKEVFKQKVTLQDSQTLEVEIDASTAPAPPVSNVSVPATPATQTTPASESQPTWGRSIPFFAGGLLLAGGSVASFLLMAAAQRSTEANCAAQHAFDCDADAAGAGRIRTWETLGWVSGGLAVVSIGVGVALIATGSSSDKTHKRASVSAAPLVSRSTWGLALEARF